jgi:precorrin-6B methylase 2
MRIARGLWIVFQRRGLRFFTYMMAGVLWPKALYRTAWGDTAPGLNRRVFERLGRTLGAPVGVQARHTGLVAQGAQPAARPATSGEIERLMERAHAAGVVGVRHAFATVVRTAGGDVRFTDLSAARVHRRGSAHFAFERDRDRSAFNERFGTDLLTETEVRRQLRALKANVPSGYRDYAPIDFGGGLTVGQIASTDSGTGRWEFFNRQVVLPLVAGKRVLDLGSNNGSLPLMMLRDGASQVVAIEGTPAIADFARFNARVLAWRDLRSYDIRVLTGDMRLFLTADLGRFDVVSAFCSLYYLPENDMVQIIARAAAMGATLILQANESIDNLPARADQLQTLMGAGGYTDIRRYTAPEFGRPLLVGMPLTAAVDNGQPHVPLVAVSDVY